MLNSRKNSSTRLNLATEDFRAHGSPSNFLNQNKTVFSHRKVDSHLVSDVFEVTDSEDENKQNNDDKPPDTNDGVIIEL